MTKKKCHNCGFENIFYNQKVKKCKTCTFPVYKNTNSNKILDLKKRSSILALIESKRSGILRLKCNDCNNESPGDIVKNRIACSYCKSYNIYTTSPFGIVSDSGRSVQTNNVSAQVIKYKKLTKLKSVIVQLNECLKNSFSSDKINDLTLKLIKEIESEISSL